MNLILAIPFELRLAAIFLFGCCLGGVLNRGVYRLAWHPRDISPWSRPSPDAPPRRRGDRLPLVGWLGLRRESSLHGRGFWVRPLLIELFTGLGFAALYWWEIDQKGLLPPGVAGEIPAGVMTVLHAQFACHLMLISLMIVASFIDVDEKIIPDTITVPGTWLALTLSAAYPWSLPPVVTPMPGGRVGLDFLQLTSPTPIGGWPAWLFGFPQTWSLVLGLGCWWLWCVALLPRSWYSRHGWTRAFQLMVARLRREAATRLILVMTLIGSAGIASVWCWGGLPRWAGLLSALVGIAASGGLVWLVRIVGAVTLRREAMGFGDVTLMAMIGAFLGWQPCLMIFFLAPFAGLVVGVLQLILRRGREIPYGPFLCMATVFVIVRWAFLWQWIRPPLFELGWIVPLMVLFCLGLMALMLAAWRLLLGLFR